jgi:hypothetical protein
MNGKFVFYGEFVEGVKVRTHETRVLFLKYHDHKIIIWVSTRTNNAYSEQFLNNFLNFIFVERGMKIGRNIGWKDIGDEGME